jgi:CBS domain-containing protein
VDVLARMNRTGSTRMVVREGDRLAGIVSLRDLLSFLALKLDLGEDEGAPAGMDKAA